MKTSERLLSAVVDLQHYVKHSHDSATCAACPRWDELQQAAVAAVDALSAADLAAAAYRDRADRSAAKMHAEIERLREDAERYHYLRNRVPADVLNGRGPSAGVWCDMDNELGDLVLVTGDDLDAEVDAALKETK
ncbi:hypothetical protein EBZ80_20840 [bacterium]|nr:hypothetical protein [bacterium]